MQLWLSDLEPQLASSAWKCGREIWKWENVWGQKVQKAQSKQEIWLHPQVRACPCPCVCVSVCVSCNNNSAHTPTSVASLPPTKERENKQVRERSQHKVSLRWLREQEAMPKGEGEKERKGGENERKLLESKFTRWYMKAYQAANRVSARDIAVNSPGRGLPRGRSALG